MPNAGMPNRCGITGMVVCMTKKIHLHVEARMVLALIPAEDLLQCKESLHTSYDDNMPRASASHTSIGLPVLHCRLQRGCVEVCTCRPTGNAELVGPTK